MLKSFKIKNFASLQLLNTKPWNEKNVYVLVSTSSPMNFLAEPRHFAVLVIVKRKKFCAMQSKNEQQIFWDAICASTAWCSSRPTHSIKTHACPQEVPWLSSSISLPQLNRLCLPVARIIPGVNFINQSILENLYFMYLQNSFQFVNLYSWLLSNL